MSKLPHLSTDQVAAFVELSRAGQIRSTADTLGITEQGVRNRLVALEAQLGVELYRKSRGPRRATVLTPQGQQFLPYALAFLERAHELCRACDVDTGQQQLRVVASQYLTRYVLIDVLKDLARCRAVGARAGQHDARVRSHQRARERSRGRLRPGGPVRIDTGARLPRSVRDELERRRCRRDTR